MRERDRLMAECARVLRPGGRMALCDIMLRRPMPFEEVRRLRVPLGAAARRLRRRPHGTARATTQSLRRRQRVWTSTAELDLTAATRPTFARWRENAERHRDEVVAPLGEDDWQRFVDSCDVLEGFWDDGTLGYGLVAASSQAGSTSLRLTRSARRRPRARVR